jgi:hypothetical protein
VVREFVINGNSQLLGRLFDAARDAFDVALVDLDARRQACGVVVAATGDVMADVEAE